MLSKEGLDQIFQMIGYTVTEEQMAEIVDMLFEKKEYIDFDKFLDLFKLQLNDLTKSDIKNAFKVLAKDDDQFIPLSLIKEIISENSGLSPNDALFLNNQIMKYVQENDKVNFIELLKNFDIK